MINNIIQVMIANIIYMALSILNNFLLPKYLSVDSYALFKTYALYMTYAGLLHFGYNDGMYLKYGGKNINTINRKEIGTNFKSYILMEVIVACVIAMIATIIEDKILLFFSIGFIFNNIIAFLQSLYQATGEFKSYGKALNAQTMIVLLINIIWIFIFKVDSYVFFIGSQIVVGLIVSCILLVQLNRKIHFLHEGGISIKASLDNIKSGFILMVGNLSGKIFTSIDRWFVKILLLVIDFAQYSFAVSIDTVVNTFISPITVTLYNKFCKSHDDLEVKKAKQLLLIWTLFVTSAAFPAQFIIEKILPEYMGAISVMYFLLASQVPMAVVKGIYVNIYKAEKRQSIYLKQTLIMTVFAAVINGIMYLLLKNMVSFAIGTLITNIVWLLICEFTNKHLMFAFKDYLFGIIELCIFIFTGTMLNPIVGFVLYFISLLIVSNIFMNESFHIATKIIKEYYKKFILRIRR